MTIKNRWYWRVLDWCCFLGFFFFSGCCVLVLTRTKAENSGLELGWLDSDQFGFVIAIGMAWFIFSYAYMTWADCQYWEDT